MFIQKNCSAKGQAKEKGIENMLADCIGMVVVWVEAELLSVLSMTVGSMRVTKAGSMMNS